MPLDDDTFVLLNTALVGAISHYRLHSDDPGTGEANAIGSGRVAVTPTTNAKVVTVPTINATGLPASGPVKWVTLWSASTNGTRRGKYAIAGDQVADSSGAFTIAPFTITGSASGQ